MGDVVHIGQMVLDFGVDETKRRLPSEVHSLIDASSRTLSEADPALCFAHSGFSLTYLPRKRPLGEERPGRRKPINPQTLLPLTAADTLQLVPGLFPTELAQWRVETPVARLIVTAQRHSVTGRFYGMPFGPMSRMLLYYIQTQALKNRSQVVHLGNNATDLLKRMGVAVGGKNRVSVRDQFNRLSTSMISFERRVPGERAGNGVRPKALGPTAPSSGTAYVDINVVMGSVLMQDPDDHDAEWPTEVMLHPDFFRALEASAVPLRETALRALATSAMSLDIYAWLAYRAHSIGRDTPIDWASIAQQFHSTANTRSFKRDFKENLTAVLAVYPELRLDVTDTALILKPSPPPVPETHRLQVIR